MKKRIICLVLSLIMVVGLLSGCSPKPAAQDTAANAAIVVKIATVSPLSGAQAAGGESIKNGAQLALEEKVAEFAQLGINLQLSPQDDQADPKVGVSVAQKLIVDNDLLAVVGHYNSGVAIPASEVYKKGNLPMVSPANVAPALTDRGYDTINRVCARDDVQGPAIADVAFNLVKAKKLFIIQDKTTFGQGIADQVKLAFEKLGGEIVGYEGITPGESDFNGVLNKVAAVKPDALFFGGMYPEGGLIVKQMNEKQITAKFIGCDGVENSDFVKIGGNAVIDQYYTSTCANISKSEKGAAWVKTYSTKFGKDPEAWAVYGYDSMGVVLDALKRVVAANPGVKPTRELLTKAIRETNGYQGIATTVSFDKRGDNIDALVYVYQYKEAKYPADLVNTVESKPYLKP